ncbi:MAG: hypothetical protein ABS900_10360, partial [Candidatus Limivicinus sp.]
FKDNERYISPSDTIDSYYALDLKVKSPDNVWKRAIEIFRNRIEGRYIVPMDHGTERREAS